MQARGVATTNFGMIDNAQAAYAVLPQLKAAALDLLFVDMLTYATSSTFGILIRELDIPVVLVALQPLARLDYAHATIEMQLKNDNICSLPEFAGVAVRMGKPVPPMIIGTLEDDPRRRPRSTDGAPSPGCSTTSRARGSATSAMPSRRCSTCTPTRRR